MRSKDIVTGLIVLAVIIVGFFWFKRVRTERQNALTIPTPSAEEKISETFNGLVIPEDAEKAELKDVSGGNGVGIATRDMVLADLPDPEAGYFYQVWVEKDGKLTSLGKMRVAKGGFLFEGRIDGGKVVVTREKVFDSNLEVRVLEGSF